MPDDYHPLMPRRNPEDINLGRIQSDLEFPIERTERYPQGTSPQAALRDDRECRARHRLDRAILAALLVSHADLLEPHGGRLGVRHPFSLRRDERDN